jgi:prolyl oligopeptidase
MKMLKNLVALLFLVSLLSPLCLLAQDTAQVSDDPYLWLENRDGEKALEWVKKHDDATLNAFKDDPNFLEFQKEALQILTAEDRIPYGNIRGNYVYNFWQDEKHIRGILRRTTLEEYKKKDPQWETFLDIDELNEKEGQSWVYMGSYSLPPDYTRGLIFLSSGGKDAIYVREFDYVEKAFVKDGFYLPEAKSSVAWYDKNTLIVGTDYGPGSLTTSGYPRVLKLWKRGTPLSEARTIMEGESTDVSVDGQMEFRPEGNVFFLSRGVSFWESINWIVDSNLNKVELPFPGDAVIISSFKGYIVVLLYSDWLGIPEGSLVAVKIKDLQSDNLRSKVEIIFTPDDKTTINEAFATKDYIVISVLQNVRGKIFYYSPESSGDSTRWIRGEINLPDFGTVSASYYSDYNNILMISFQDFLTPTKLYFLADPKATPEEIKSLPAMFDAANLQMVQFETKSKDGTTIPYFLISKKDLSPDGRNPTLLYGYGGFRSPQTPAYSGTVGKLWLEKGGAYALANIRGGTEFGPEWHKAALLKNRQKSFDDFIAVAEDLIERKVTSPKHLGIMGGSNGGLLVGVAFTQRPDLLNAVVCQVPLLDMLRYTKLPPGASWIAEYGDPDSADIRPYIEKYSPYQNLKTGVKYPEVLFITSTADDRVHPGHARKMAARMEALGNKIYFYEETEGGHGASADNLQRAKRLALENAYLLRMLK